MARVKLTSGRIASFECPEGKHQAFLWDAQVPQLALRVTRGGARAFVFQAQLNQKTVRTTIGTLATWTIPDARNEARRLQGMIDQGKDPRVEKAKRAAEEARQRDAAKVERRRREVSGLDAWTVYTAERASHWSDRTLHDNRAAAAPGGEPHKRLKGRRTQPGLLHALLSRPLSEIDALAVEQWIDRETKSRGASVALAFRMLRAFINWCAEHPDYRHIVCVDACKPRRVRERVPKLKAKNDALQREQLAAWFEAVRRAPPVASAYLQALLLTGARREELMALEWEDVDFRWRSMILRDKVEGERTIALTPYIAQLLSFLPKRNRWVFSSTLSKSGRLQDPGQTLRRAVDAAGLPHLTMHGLRRSFGTLSEWVEVPAGIAAQIQGHKPSATAEKHYRVRPLDLLRTWQERIEGWILGEAGIEQPKAEQAGSTELRVVAGTDTTR